MRKIYLILIMCLFVSTSNAQIGGTDTSCKGGTGSYMDSSTADTYAWVLDTFNTVQTGITGSALIDLKSYGAPYGVIMVHDNTSGNYYAFMVMRLGKLLRIDFTTNPYTPISTSNITDLGNLGGVLGDSTHGIDVINDGTNWYGFITRNDRIIRVDFGTSLVNNSPTTSVMKFASNMDYAYQITIKKYGNEWLGFVANRSSNAITRFDFGTTLTSTPTATNFGNNFQLSRPSQFSLYKESNNWYMIVSNIGSGGGPGGNGGISRFEFGSNLKNNTPTGNLLGSFSGKLSQPRGMNIIGDCNQVYALVCNNNSKVTLVDFKNSIATATGSIATSDLGTLSLGTTVNIQCTYPFWYNGRLSLLATSLDDSVLYMYDNVYSLPSSGQASYSVSTYTKALTSGGITNVTLHANQGSPRGPEAYCKQTYVINTVQVSIIQHGLDTLYASGTSCDWYVWKLNGVIIPGATSRSYVPTQTGVYTCTGGKSSCSSTSNYYFEFKSVASTPYSKNIMVYPNPTNGIFNIEVNGLHADKKFNVTCYNAIGTVVAVKTIETANGNGKTSIDISNLAKGIYQLKLQSEGQASIIKTVIVE